MISVVSGVFKLDTPHTTYMFRVTESGHPEHLYYGRYLPETGDISAYQTVTGLRLPTVVNYSDEQPRLYMTLPLLEASSMGKGDLREPLFAGELGNSGNTVFDFQYESYRIISDESSKNPDEEPEKNTQTVFDDSTLPRTRKNGAETLSVILCDPVLKIRLELFYTVYPDSDVIVRSTNVINDSAENLTVRSLYSMQLDLPCNTMDVLSCDGAWMRERQLHRTRLTGGTFSIESLAGSSSAEHNPLLIIERDKSAVMSNLLWSGDHRESVELSPYGTARILTGLNPSTFSFHLFPGQKFRSPEAVMAYSADGQADLTEISHDFIRRYISPLPWSNRERPILLNSWEGMGFDLNEENVRRQADSARDLGIELFVLDDGWFRNGMRAVGDLGDWEPAKEKFPHGLKPVCDYIHSIGLLTGIWAEPEMISIDSDIYRAHPDWLVRCPGRNPSPGRDQYLMDMTRKDVVDYIYGKLEKLIDNNGFDYLKWDMNRYLADDYSEGLWIPEFRYRWVMGVYRLLQRLTVRFPELLIEGCSSGGSRFDLGMLCYVNQIWGSDNTDATSRVSIFAGTVPAYPQCAFGAHVSRIPNGITGRVYDRETAFNVNAFGAFGYELDVTKLSENERKMIAWQIRFYKEYRRLFQYGRFRLVRNDNTVIWTVTDEEKGCILALYLEKRATFSQVEIRKLVVPSCREDKMYSVTTRSQIAENPEACARRGGVHSSEKFQCTVPGALLKGEGMSLMPVMMGTDYPENAAWPEDWWSRLFILQEST